MSNTNELGAFVKESDLTLKKFLQICNFTQISKLQASAIKKQSSEYQANIVAIIIVTFWVSRQDVAVGRAPAKQQIVPYNENKSGMQHFKCEYTTLGRMFLNCDNINYFSRMCNVSHVQAEGPNDQVIYLSNGSHSD